MFYSWLSVEITIVNVESCKKFLDPDGDPGILDGDEGTLGDDPGTLDGSMNPGW